MPSSCHLLFPYNGDNEGFVVKNLIWIYRTEKKSVTGFCTEVKIPGSHADICHVTVGEKSVGNVLTMSKLQVVRD